MKKYDKIVNVLNILQTCLKEVLTSKGKILILSSTLGSVTFTTFNKLSWENFNRCLEIMHCLLTTETSLLEKFCGRFEHFLYDISHKRNTNKNFHPFPKVLGPFLLPNSKEKEYSCIVKL